MQAVERYFPEIKQNFFQEAVEMLEDQWTKCISVEKEARDSA